MIAHENGSFHRRRGDHADFQNKGEHHGSDQQPEREQTHPPPLEQRMYDCGQSVQAASLKWSSSILSCSSGQKTSAISLICTGLPMTKGKVPLRPCCRFRVS